MVIYRKNLETVIGDRTYTLSKIDNGYTLTHMSKYCGHPMYESKMTTITVTHDQTDVDSCKGYVECEFLIDNQSAMSRYNYPPRENDPNRIKEAIQEAEKIFGNKSDNWARERLADRISLLSANWELSPPEKIDHKTKTKPESVTNNIKQSKWKWRWPW